MKMLAIIKDTFRECLVKKILLSFFIASNIGILGLLLVINIDIVDNEAVISSLFFEGEEWASMRQLNEGIIKLEGVLAMAIFTIGLFLSLFSTADIIPSIMTKGRLDLYLARPVSRAQLLIGKYLGAVFVVTANIVYAIVGIWLVIGFKTGVWNVYFLYSGLTIVFMFAVLYAVLTLIGVFSKSTSVLIIAVYLLISISPVLAQRDKIFLFPLGIVWETVIDALYWIVPKYYELTVMTHELVEGLSILSWTPIISNLIIALVALNLGIFIFSKKSC